jgi:hypothetical protein
MQPPSFQEPIITVCTVPLTFNADHILVDGMRYGIRCERFHLAADFGPTLKFSIYECTSNEEILKVHCATKVQLPYKLAFLEDHLFSLDKVPHTSSGLDVFLSEMLKTF